MLLDPPLWPAQLGEARFLDWLCVDHVAFLRAERGAGDVLQGAGALRPGRVDGSHVRRRALPRCLGPSWSLYALQLACVLFPRPARVSEGRRTCLEFGISALIFGATLVTVGRTRRRLRPYDADDDGGERARWF